MPITLQLTAPAATYAFQEEIVAQVVIAREEGEELTVVPRPLWHPDVLRLQLRHADGTLEDRSPARGHRTPALRLLKSRAEEETVEVRIAPPLRPGQMTVQLEATLGARHLRAPEVSLTVLPPLAVALSVAAVLQEEGSPSRILQLARGGALLEHPLVKHGPEVHLGAATRLDTLPGDARVVPAMVSPGADSEPPRVVVLEGDSAFARRYGEPAETSAPVRLRAASEPAPVLVGPPLLLHDRLAFAWAVGPFARVALFAFDGGAPPPAPLEALLPGPVLRGCALGDRRGDLDLLLHVNEGPGDPAGHPGLVRLGSAGLPRPSATASTPPHADFLWLVQLRAGKLLAPVRLAALPPSTLSLTCSAGLWGVEREGQRYAAFHAALDAGSLRAARRRPFASGRELGGKLEALAATESSLQGLWLDHGRLRLADTEGGAREVALSEQPDFAGLAGARVVLFDRVRGLHLLE